MSLDLISIRRELHQVPELAFHEFETKAILLKYLKTLPDITIIEFFNSPGMLVEYSHGNGLYRLFRADMDALPVKETTGCDFMSRNEGIMHSCGHDIHMTILLGLIEEITKIKPAANLLFLFQPAEEGQGGAESILAEGIIQQYPVESVYALHIASGMPVGTVSSRPGIFFGVPQEFNVEFYGITAHAVTPEKGIDALRAGRIFLDLMDYDIDELSQKERVIFHTGKIEAGTVRNVVPDYCKMEGTHRALDKKISSLINGYILNNCDIVQEETGAKYEVDFLQSYDPVVNDSSLVEKLKNICQSLNIEYQEAEPTLTGEDFGFFTTLYPGLLFWLGSGCDFPLHSDKFLPSEDAIPIGINIFKHLALK